MVVWEGASCGSQRDIDTGVRPRERCTDAKNPNTSTMIFFNEAMPLSRDLKAQPMVAPKAHSQKMVMRCLTDQGMCDAAVEVFWLCCNLLHTSDKRPIESEKMGRMTTISAWSGGGGSMRSHGGRGKRRSPPHLCANCARASSRERNKRVPMHKRQDPSLRPNIPPRVFVLSSALVYPRGF
jgi:hypothetical protein